MNKLDLVKLSMQCVRGDSPACAAACPFELDIRSFMEKMQTGKYDSAYKIYSKAVIFPAIISHICPAACEKACVRSKVDAPVAISALERACCQFNLSKVSSSFIPDKKKKILVAGGGMAGLGAAVRLSQRGYHVQLVESRSELGGSLWNIDETRLPRADLIAEMNGLSQNKFLTVQLGRRLENLDDYIFDAAFLAIGDTRGITGIDGRSGIFTMESMQDRISNPIESICAGMKMSLPIEAFLQSAKPVMKPELQSRYHPDTSQWKIKNPVLEHKKKDYTPEQVSQEAARCERCTCDACMKACEVLPYYYSDPVTVILDINGSINKTELTTKKGQKFINSCTFCGVCKKVCSYGIDFKEICLSAKQIMQENNDMPPVYHEFWINDMMDANSEESRLIKIPNDRKTVQYVFFPGCQMAGSDPLYVTGTYELLLRILKGNVGIMQMCCGIPAHWSGLTGKFEESLTMIRSAVKELGNPAVILACPSCLATFQEYLPQIQVYSLWDILKPENFPGRESTGKTVCVFDPCVSKDTVQIQKNIRNLVNHLGYHTEELSYPCEEAKCCGYGGHVYSANAKLFDKTVQSAAGLSDNEYVTYCVNCRDCFATQNKEASHILDYILFPNEERQHRNAPGISQRRINRLKAKQLLLKKFWNIDFEKEFKPQDEFVIHYSDKTADKLNELLILEDNIRKTLLYGKNSGHIIYDSKDGSFVCHLQQGFQTYYVQFIINDDGSYTVINAYKHRMKIMESTENAGRKTM